MSLANEAVQDLFADISRVGITFSKLARRAGVTRATLNNWRSKRTLPTLEKYLEVRRALDEQMEQIRR
jgi:transcriptional regulator with XRE-family HTH domain